jgi:hypothetical protein
MGTPGLFTVIIKDKEYQFCNRFDSYPWGLGSDLLELLATHVKTWSDAEVSEFLRVLMDPEQMWTFFEDSDRFAGIYKAIMTEYEYILDMDDKLFRVSGDEHAGLYDISDSDKILQLIESFYPTESDSEEE